MMALSDGSRATRCRIPVAFVVVLVVSGWLGSASSAGASIGEEDLVNQYGDAVIAAASAVRTSVGLEQPEDWDAFLSSPEVLQNLSVAGFPFLDSELLEWGRRSSFMREIEKVRFLIESEPTFAGAYFDHHQHGSLVVLTTGDVKEQLARLAPLMPESSLGLQVLRAERTLVQLQKDAATIVGSEELGREVDLLEVSIDVRSNSLRFGVRSVSAGAADATEEWLLAAGVKSHAVLYESSVPVPVACFSRDYCYSPLKAGNRIRSGGTDGALCGMGFHFLLNGNDRQFLTAGHCGSIVSNWSHLGYGHIGQATASLYYNGGHDVLRVQMPDSQASHQVIFRSTQVNAVNSPWTGEGICVSRANTTGFVCGTVSTRYVWYWLGVCTCWLLGGEYTGILIQPGDSGSPIVWEPDQRYAVGLISTTGGSAAAPGAYARIYDVVNSSWNVDFHS